MDTKKYYVSSTGDVWEVIPLVLQFDPGPYRQGTKYRKSPDHKPKPQEPARSAWREHKRFAKDRYPRHWFSGSGCRRFFKKLSNKQLRRYEKTCLESERYEDLGKEDLKLFHDPWKWD